MPALPPQFDALQPFVADWALKTEKARHDFLVARCIAELRPFYDAMLPEMEAVMDYLKAQPADKLPPEVQSLLDLALTFAETAHPLDLKWKDVDFPSALAWEKMEFRSVSLER